MSKLRGMLSVALVGATLFCAVSAVAQPVESKFESGTRELSLAQLSVPGDERKSHAVLALSHFGEAYESDRSWRSAAGAADAALLARGPTLAGAWYWLAADASDYSQGYLDWQRGALDRIFSGRPARVFEFDDRPASVRVDRLELPVGAFDRSLPYEAGKHEVLATSLAGGTARQTFEVQQGEPGKTKSIYVTFRLPNNPIPLAESEMPHRRGPLPPPADDGMSTLQVVTIVATVTLATGIAVGGGYLLLGESNPRGIDTAEGAVVIATELLLIGGGVTIAILSD